MPRAIHRITTPLNVFASEPAATEPASLEVPATPAEEVPLANSVFMVGEYLVGDGEDARLGGHPDIRY